MFGLFGKDWNVVAVMFERSDLYRVNGQRAKGKAATKAKDGARLHERTIMWAVFDQKGALLESGEGPASMQIGAKVVQQLQRELRTNRTVLDIMKALETKESANLSKPLVWTGYPRKAPPPRDD
ncbi:MAG: hypothetical protein KDA90_04010 [Planctomycetaceae bacterium]|nr:hypothetical protein [Planctomycetaceae bacterium]